MVEIAWAWVRITLAPNKLVIKHILLFFFQFLEYLFNLMQNKLKEPIKQRSQLSVERNLFSSN